MSEQLLVCKALAAMVRKHGDATEEEVAFVAHTALELALTAEENGEVQKVLKQGGHYPGLIAEITSKPMRTYLFRRVVAATLIDEQIEDDEMALIHQTARAFDFDAAVLKDYLQWMQDGIAWEKRGAEITSRL